MNARAAAIKPFFRSVCVDLDGTLLATDTLAEGVMRLLKGNPLMVFLLPYWWLLGKARLKAEVATRTNLDVGSLPYRRTVLDALELRKAEGSQLFLTTGAHRTVAEAVARHLGIFDGVFFTEGDVNLTSHAKRDLLVAKFGEKGFDYFGNSRDDIEIFEHAGDVTVVAPDAAAKKWAQGNATGVIEGEMVSWKTYLKAIRVHQWLKNSLVFAPLFLSHMEYQVAAVVQVVIAFFAFSFAASAVYILNDLIDLQSDRQHATKRNRPFAAGKLSIFTGAQMAVGLSIASGLLATLLPLAFGVSLLVYAAITTAYSFWLKKKLLVDVFTLAGLYSLRVIAGAAAIGTDNSFWLLAFSLFFFLGLALVKRQVELAAAVSLPSHGALSGRGYRASDLDVISMSGLCAAFASVLVLALYIDSPEVRTHYNQPWLLWPLCPMTLYLTIRIWVLAYRGEMKEDPVQFLMMDWRSQLVIAAGAALVMLATIV